MYFTDHEGDHEADLGGDLGHERGHGHAEDHGHVRGQELESHVLVIGRDPGCIDQGQSQGVVPPESKTG